MVVHAKDAVHRDMNVIVQRLVRNNAWIAQRYAPASELKRELTEVRDRYKQIALKEKARKGYRLGRDEVKATLAAQPRTPMPLELWERFVGLAAARAALAPQVRRGRIRTAAIVDEGKNAWVVKQALAELGVRVLQVAPGKLASESELREQGVEALAIGTMSPGPMLDAYFSRTSAMTAASLPVLMPWLVGELPAKHEVPQAA
jgi:hypothetical protein